MQKIKTQKQVIKLAENFKKQGKIVVTYNGSFDLLHPGHIASLKEAKKQGDVLLVLVNSDKSVKAYKGPNRPIQSQKERTEVLAALSCIDFITIFNEINPKTLLAKIKPDVHCVGFDWGKNCVEREVIEKNGGRIHVLKQVPGFSTSGLINKSEPKAVFLDRDGTINVNKPEYLHRIEDFKFTSRAIPALRKLSNSPYKIIILTNQSGIGRGYFKEKDLKKLHQWMVQKLKSRGVRIDKIYYCPHRPEDGCSCRKPKIGMLLKAVKDFGINLSKSWVVGDDDRDILMAKEANLKSIKIGGNKNLLEAVKIILSKHEK